MTNAPCLDIGCVCSELLNRETRLCARSRAEVSNTENTDCLRSGEAQAATAI
jgi:hypothetical protein